MSASGTDFFCPSLHVGIAGPVMSGTKIDFRGHALLPSVGLPLRMASSKVGAGATQITVMHKSGLPPQPAAVAALGSCSNKTPVPTAQIGATAKVTQL